MNKASWNKVLALLLSIMMLLSMCAFAEPVIETDEHAHEQETVTVEETKTEETVTEETTTEETVVEETVTEETVTEETATEETVVEETVTEETVTEETTTEETVTEETTTEETTTEETVTEETAVGAVAADEAVAVPMVLDAAPAAEEVGAEVGEDYGIDLLMIGDDVNIDDSCRNHVFREENGNCLVCGKACAHDSIEGDYYRVSFEIIDESYHIEKYIWIEYCLYCGLEKNRDESDGWEEEVSHLYDQDGVCFRCGYEKTSGKCAHENIRWDGEEAIVVSFEQVDASTHKAVKQDVKWGACEDCEASIEQNVGETYTVTEDHKFNADEFSICTVCDYKCAHPTTVQQNTYENYKDGEWYFDYSYVNNKYHTQTLQLILQKRCTVCSRQSFVESGKFVDFQSEHYCDSEGFCYDCEEYVGKTNEEAECEHEFETIIDHMWDRCTYVDEMKHEVKLAAYELDVCKKCGYTNWEDERRLPDQDKVETENHNFSDGQDGGVFIGECWDCNYRTKCVHPNLDTWTYTTFVSISEYNDQTHTGEAVEYENYECEDCGLYYRCATGEVATFTEEHYMYENECTECGYTPCAHANVEEKSVEAENFIEIEGDDAQHNWNLTKTTSKVCKDCGNTVGEPVVVVLEEAKGAHVYNDNQKCTFCDHMCGHSNKVLGEAVTETVYTSDDSTHASTSRTTTPYTCANCEISGTDVLDTIGDAEKHTYVEGVCSVCNHTCVHGNAASEETKVLNGYTDLVDASHTAQYTVTTVTTCPDCGNVVTKSEDTTEIAAHTYLDSKCQDCDHVCAHSNPVAAEKFVAKSYEKKSGSKHIATGEVYEVVNCNDCGVILSETLTAENVQVEEKHAMSSGKCKKCGYVKPVEEPVVEETVVEEEPVFVEVEATEEVRGVTVAEAPEMVKTLVTVIEAIEADGEATSLVIENVEKILSVEEHEQLTQLKVTEQMLVLLQIMGFGDEVQAMLDASETALSENAVLVGSTIQARISAMTEEELEAFKALIAELFSSMMGEEQEIVFTLTYVVGDKTTSEQYSFRQVENTWVLTRISLAA